MRDQSLLATETRAYDRLQYDACTLTSRETGQSSRRDRGELGLRPAVDRPPIGESFRHVPEQVHIGFLGEVLIDTYASPTKLKIGNEASNDCSLFPLTQQVW